jgi:cytochrome c2
MIEGVAFMKRTVRYAFAAFVALSAASSMALADQVEIEVTDAAGNKLKGDPAAGEKVFKQCQTCHYIVQGKNFTGPTLYGIIGRTAGTVPGFSYSKANKESGKVWTEQAMFEYLENPRKTIPGTKMSFVGLKKPQDRADVIAFIQMNSGPASGPK